MFGDLVDFSKLDVVDLLRSGAILVGFIFAFLSDKKGGTRVWRLADCIFLGLYGLAAFFFPSLLLGYLTVGELDNFHLYLVQSMSVGSIALGVVSYRQFLTSSKDPQVTGGWLLSRVVGFIFVMLNGALGKLSLAKEDVRFADQFVSSSGVGFGLLWVGSMVKLWQHYSSENGGGSSSSSGKPHTILNQHLLVTILLTLPIFVLNFGMPALVIEGLGVTKYDNLHLHITRTIGGMGLTYLLQEMTALQYDSDGDKREFFLGHIVAVTLTLLLVILNQLKYSLFSGLGLGALVIGLLLILATSISAVFKSSKDKKL